MGASRNVYEKAYSEILIFAFYLLAEKLYG